MASLYDLLRRRTPTACGNANGQSEYVNTGRFSRECGKSFRVAFDQRCDADYTDVAAFTADQVAAMLEQARRFVAEVKSLLQAT